jgi:hypothetical protein
MIPWLVKHGLHDGLARPDWGPAMRIMVGLTPKFWLHFWALELLIIPLIVWAVR